MKYTAVIVMTIEAKNEDEAQAIADSTSKFLPEEGGQIKEAWVEELGEFVEDDPNNHN